MKRLILFILLLFCLTLLFILATDNSFIKDDNKISLSPKAKDKQAYGLEEVFNNGFVFPENLNYEQIPPQSQREIYESNIDELKDLHYEYLPPLPRNEQVSKEEINQKQKSSPLTGNVVRPPSFQNSPCSASFTRTLTPQQLVDYIKQKDENCLYSFLWAYNQDILQTLNNNNMIAVLDELNVTSFAYNGINENGVYNLLYFIHAAHYWEFYYSSSLNFNSQVYAKTDTSLRTLSQNPHLFDYSTNTNKLLNEWITTVDTADLFHKYVPHAERILEDFRRDLNAVNDYYRRSSTYSTFYAMSRVNLNDPQIRTIYSNSISQRTINAITNISLYQGYMPSYTYLINNAMWSFGKILRHIPAYNAPARIALTDAIYNYSYLSEPYLWAVYTLDVYNNCTYGYTNLLRLCISDLRSDILNLALPNSFSFEDNSIKFRTRLSVNDAERLYHAVKDVDQQLFRLTGSRYPVEGDKTKLINLVIYGSLQDYKTYQPFLYGYGTNNGGLYIESIGTLFTYQRTPQQSSYTLEELLRHEYTHYLQGRYLIKGLWGQTAFYNNGRLVWFEEGGAEFLAGSSSDNGIKIRKNLVNKAMSYSQHPSISDIVRSTYSSPPEYYYTYGGILFQFLYEQRKNILFNLINMVISEDISGYDNLISTIAQDQTLNTQFQTYINSQIANLSNLVDPNTSWFNSSNFENNVSQIQIILNSSPNYGWLLKCNTSSVNGLPRFTCNAPRSAPVSNTWTEITAWNYFNNYLNDFYSYAYSINKDLFKELNCRFGEIRFVQSTGGNYPITDYYCEGPLGMGSHLIERSPQKIQQELSMISISYNNLCSLTQNTNVFCTGTIDSGQHTSQNAAQAEIDYNLDNLNRKLFSSNPQYYRDLLVAKQGNPSVFNNNGMIWIRQNVNVTINMSMS